ncbi:hypothetical protein M406DRAFT_45821 [Cryphonectria parasitica EP155]|uniref:J domain-containing protein n=1 Tax=Cryphonectria parasitica (strain ATCC 38755 / EP155) TaxID=660469 RepID=A0A9P4XY58_CRYP1|nr:uncharacterized protein M406DRAFT_45821 [Cryphonectria parasitica EP155]KAF3762940.1 hypothetical protein M406DRAFT_45821 [Cryphonectria parasitica EP155]
MSQWLSLMGWTILPDMATRFLQNLYYNVTIRAGSPRPQPGQQRWAEHYRRTYIVVICAYLLFTIYEADWELQRPANRDFYSVLGVPPDAGLKDIKRRYRQLSAAMHPDKASLGPTAFDADLYVRVQLAHETLSDEVKRFAYDRFGPDMTGWTRCTVVRDYVMTGATGLVGYYGVGAVFLYVLPMLGYFSDGVYWRYLAFAALLTFEVRTITSPNHPWLLEGLVNPFLVRIVNPVVSFWSPGAAHPPYLPFQAVAMARKLSVTLSIALNQILPRLTADTRGGRLQLRKSRGDDELSSARQSLDELDKAVVAANEEAERLVKTEAAPFMGDPQLWMTLRDKIKRWLVDNTVRNDPLTKAAIHERIKRRRQDAPAGAQGNGMRMRQKPAGMANGNASAR